MATVYRIHPAIGIARVGNSPGEFFIGPERRGEIPDPQGGFKDAQCRVKRQAARFRIFAHHDNGTYKEITEAEADITWTVHLANRAASYPGRGSLPVGRTLARTPGARLYKKPAVIPPSTRSAGSSLYHGSLVHLDPVKPHGVVRHHDGSYVCARCPGKHLAVNR